jgi:phenylalanyl-tRNA synthetase beta chain
VLVCSLVELGGRVESVRLEGGEGPAVGVTPDLEPRSMDIEIERARRWLGLPLDATSLTAALERMRLAVAPVEGQPGRFRVTYPSFRSDVRHMVDLFEDLAIGFGYEHIQPALVPSMTAGSPRPAEVVSGLARTALLGLGFSEVMSLPMTTEEDHYTRLRLPVPERYPRVGNPKLKSLTVAREHLMGGVLAALRENRRRPVPIRLFELDDAFELSAEAATGVRESRRVCVADMGPEAGYAAVRSVLDALLRELGELAVYEPLVHPTFAAGRAARLRAGRFSGVIGEVHAEVIAGLGLDWPTALFEVVLAPSGL